MKPQLKLVVNEKSEEQLRNEKRKEIAQKIKDNKAEIVALNAKIANSEGDERKQLILQRNMADEHQGYLKKAMKKAQSQKDKQVA